MNIELFNQEITTRKINELVYLILITYKNEINSKFHVNNKFIIPLSELSLQSREKYQTNFIMTPYYMKK